MRFLTTLIAFCLTAAFAPAAVLAQESDDLGPRQIAQYVTVTATVDAVDKRRRKVTLRDQSGETHVIKVGENITGLDQVDVGDTVKIEFFQDMISEVREPTPEELKTPLRIVEARPESNPQLMEMRTVHAVVTIEEIDRENLEVTVRGPMGGSRTLPVIFPERLNEAKVGDTAIITFTEAMAVSLVEL